MLGGEAGAGADLGFEAEGNGDGEAGFDEVDAAGFDGDGFGVGRKERGEVEARGEIGVVLGEDGGGSSLRMRRVGVMAENGKGQIAKGK